MKKNFIKIILILIPIIVVGVGVFVLIKPKENTSQVEPSKQTSTSYMTSDRNKIYILKDIFDSSSISKTIEYSQVYDFNNKNAVITKQDELFYLQFDNDGVIKRQVDLGSKPDLVLSVISKIFVKDKDTFFAYYVPLRGIRVFKIASDDKIEENFYPTKVVRNYSDNKIFISGNQIIIPSGDIGYLKIDLSLNVMTTEQISTEACGSGDWKTNHNENELFILKTDSEICIYNFKENKVITKLATNKTTWYKFIPEKNLLLTEAWENTNGFPNSTGKITIYNLDAVEASKNIDLSTNANFITQRNSSPGGYSLISSYYLNNENIYLITRAGKSVFLTQLNKNLEFVKFFEGQKIFYEKTVDLNS